MCLFMDMSKNDSCNSLSFDENINSQNKKFNNL